ncbi:MAG: bifunctional folylpolyglutamate synthase/dihydrofolate synthase [Planctomycetia bacterium]|nr:bifunctional folylpolyglutamate synthase/dihydrofolate synthase [Planctomycetia bacterium]
MPIETYEQAVAFWNSRINYEKIGMPQDVRLLKLDRMRLMLQLLGNPHEAFRSIHITGTKGKGSTATMIASVLQEAGYRVGLYTSPHLVRVEERIQINSQPIDQSSMIQCMRMVAEACDEVEHRKEMPPTFFEIITAVGMLHFAQQKVDYAVLEVGMGGRFDATNVVMPEVSVITSISLDHIEQLGDTVEKIAFEKAGIIKRGRPVVSGVREPGPAAVIERVAKEQEAPLYRLDSEFDGMCWPGDIRQNIKPKVMWLGQTTLSPWCELSLWGKHQADNAVIALQTLHLLEPQAKLSLEAYQQGMVKAIIPGRLEIVGEKPWLILDAAHNEASIGVLLRWLDSLQAPGLQLLFAVSKDKQIREMLKLLKGKVKQIVFTRYSSSSRGADPRELLGLWHDIGGVGGTVVEPATQAWKYLANQASSDEIVVATGSVFLVGEIRQLYHPS